jgi:hypothetical protein
MYELSRALYREIRPFLPAQTRGHALRACEEMVDLLATGRAPRRAERELFGAVRFDVDLCAQLQVRRIIDRHLAVIRVVCERRARSGRDGFGRPLACRAHTKQGRPCVRPPTDASGYCPSHRHLAEVQETVTAA